MYAHYWTIYSLSLRYFGYTVQFHKSVQAYLLFMDDLHFQYFEDGVSYFSST